MMPSTKKEDILTGIGLYVHIPFCERKCRYCDFKSFVVGDDIKKQYLDALLREIDATDYFPPASVVDTVFIGGGTPSCVPPYFIERILCKLNEKYDISESAEISMEVNPGTVDYDGLHNCKEIGINRLSIGVQSFEDNELLALGRIHDSVKAVKCINDARRAGFSNISIDLMSSIPNQSLFSFEKNLKTAVSLAPEHISVYSLILEEGTALFKDYIQNRLSLPNEDTLCEIDELTRTFLPEHGYKRYEISNYAKPGFLCRHNMGYWDRKQYRGYGLSAASLIGNERFTAEASLEAYIKDAHLSWSERENAMEYRLLTKEDIMEEFMFLGLRKTEGVRFLDFSTLFGTNMQAVYGNVIDKYTKTGHLLVRNEGDEKVLCLTKEGVDISNTILAEFLL